MIDKYNIVTQKVMNNKGEIMTFHNSIEQALDYLEGSLNEMTTDKRLYTECLMEVVKRLREENKKQHDVLSTLDEMIHRGYEHVELMKALEQGLGIPETWKEMIE
tara:strand:+ start:925 stop:1239 length:315 start_codon:yes stop_codon:yes gene_type:complete